ncbi:MAG: sulfatase-like hydrolase/transferase [Acidimicrobiales bacterium]
MATATPLFAAFALSILGIRLVSGRLADTIGPVRVMSLGVAFIVGSGLLARFAAPVAAVVGIAFVGTGWALVFPAVTAWLSGARARRRAGQRPRLAHSVHGHRARHGRLPGWRPGRRRFRLRHRLRGAGRARRRRRDRPRRRRAPARPDGTGRSCSPAMVALQAPQARIGRTVAESTPAFTLVPRRPPAPQRARRRARRPRLRPARLLRFDLSTPTIDALADGGLRYRRFHVTALCSPTRACVLTGRNHHRGRHGLPDRRADRLPRLSTGRIPPSAATLALCCGDAGYSTFAVGKWHPRRWEQSVPGLFDRWPLGQGFERYYGFLAGDTNQWTPDLVRDNGFVEPPGTPADGTTSARTSPTRPSACSPTSTSRHARQAVVLLPGAGRHARTAPGAGRVDRPLCRFDHGCIAWRDEVMARQLEPASSRRARRSHRFVVGAGVEDCSPDERRPLRPDDGGVRRLPRPYRTPSRVGSSSTCATGQLDNTVVLVLSDNGTSAEGGPTGLVQRAPLHTQPRGRRG